MGDDVTFQTERDNRRYQVTERRYAIFPQQSGKLVIPGMVFQGLVIQPMSNSMSADPFNQFFQTPRTRQVRIRSDKVTVQVEAQPASYSGANWLPAKRLTLSEIWSPENPHFKVGEPVTLTLRLQALGLTGSQLPDLELPKGSGIKQYTDQPTVKSTPKGNDILAVKDEKFAIIPTTSGKLEMPAIHLKWWNTELNREETATIPSKIVEVAPAANVAGSAPAPANPIQTEANPENQKVAVSTTRTIVNPGIWPFIAAGFAFAWLVTLVVAFLVWRRGGFPVKSQYKATPAMDSVSIKEAMASLKKACEANNANETQAALLQWARAVWPENSPRSLEQLAIDLQNSAVKQAFSELSGTLYGESSEHWNGKAFWDKVSQHLKQPKNSKTKKHKSLPGLYPQSI